MRRGRREVAGIGRTHERRQERREACVEQRKTEGMRFSVDKLETDMRYEKKEEAAQCFPV